MLGASASLTGSLSITLKSAWDLAQIYQIMQQVHTTSIHVLSFSYLPTWEQGARVTAVLAVCKAEQNATLNGCILCALFMKVMLVCTQSSLACIS